MDEAAATAAVEAVAVAAGPTAEEPVEALLATDGATTAGHTHTSLVSAAASPRPPRDLLLVLQLLS